MKRERVVISQQVGTCLFDIHVHTILDKMVNPPITGKHFLLMSQEVSQNTCPNVKEFHTLSSK